MSTYARSLPALGFDPAPGDVDLTRNLARQHSLAAQEARQALALLARLDLNPLQGRAADALRALQATFPPALRNTAAAAEVLQAAASSWAHQLSGFQSEADLLERQAAAATAHHQGLLTRQAAMPPGSAVLTADVQAASATVDGIHKQAQELHQRYLAAAGKTADGVDQHKSVWEDTEPVRKVLEAVLAPLDIVAADHWVSTLKEIAGVPGELVKGVGETLEEIENAKKAGKPINDLLVEAANFTESTGQKYDAWYAFAPGWLKTSARSIGAIRGLSSTLGVAGIIGDAGTIISPQNQGALGWADRGAALTNGGLIAADMIIGGLPVIGDVTLAATGMYLAGDYLYQHWTPFRDVANDVGHAVGSFENTLTSIKNTFSLRSWF